MRYLQRTNFRIEVKTSEACKSVCIKLITNSAVVSRVDTFMTTNIGNRTCIYVACAGYILHKIAHLL